MCATHVLRGANPPSTALRSVILTSTDTALRERLKQSLQQMRWVVREAGGGAETIGLIEAGCPEALIMDSWLPDLESSEFIGYIRLHYPEIDLLSIDGRAETGGTRSPRRNELLHALRETMEAGTELQPSDSDDSKVKSRRLPLDDLPIAAVSSGPVDGSGSEVETAGWMSLPGMIGDSRRMRELARLIRLVAPRSASVLIEGETGTGKEVVARNLHRLSLRASKPFAVLNCAAIPEALLEAELFGHTRGAFTGAVQSRIGRVEAANGGTLFLDEIGEMPLALQAKMLRFLESGEIQRVGDNETMRVDVRILAATHQLLEKKSIEGTFRLDLYHRLAVFPIEVPALRDRLDDLPLLVEFFLEQMGREMPRKQVSAAAMAELADYHWPGNVRELMHVLSRAEIMAGDQPEIGPNEIRLRRSGGR